MPGFNYPGGFYPGGELLEQTPGGGGPEVYIATGQGAANQPRVIDPTYCWVRHVVRGEEGEPSARPVANVYFVREEALAGTDGMNGRNGWQEGEPTCVLDEDGTFTLSLPNIAGDDGVLHRRRFRFFTDPEYEPGEEWIEFWRDPNDLVFVGTPDDGEKTSSRVVLKGTDLNVVLAGSLSSEVDVWDAAAPADVLAHYGRLSVVAYGADLEEEGTSGGPAFATVWSAPLSGVSADCWTAELRLRWVSPRPTAAGQGRVAFGCGPFQVNVDVYEGALTLLADSPTRQSRVEGKRSGLWVPGGVQIRLVVRYDHVFVFVQGELALEMRRAHNYVWQQPKTAAAFVSGEGSHVVVDGVHVETLAPFATHGPSAVIDRVLPGKPPASGLRGDYYNAATQFANPFWGPAGVRERVMLSSEEPIERVDPSVNFPPGTPSFPPGLPGAYAARWSGAIYLDLTSSDRNLRLARLNGWARVYIAHTMRGDELASNWDAATALSGGELQTGSLRARLGSEAGWYPIVSEQLTQTPGIVLEDQQLGGSWNIVPQYRLSPIGCYSDTVRLTDHRKVYGDVALAFGYQWRTEYRSLESGEFPGQLTFRALLGMQTNVVIDDDGVETEVSVRMSAKDVVDALSADAAGLANPSTGQLSVQSIDYSRSSKHMALRQVYESLSEISEESLIKARVNSLLALRSGPNEQVGIKHRGQRDLVDSFPLAGALAKMEWRPGDAPILRLESVDVMDEGPRQLTSVSWPMRPDGIGAPTVSFRQRIRSLRHSLRRVMSMLLGPRRNYQGVFAPINGSVGGANSAGEAVPGAADAYSRVPLPENLRAIKQVVAVVTEVSGNKWALEVGGVGLGQGARVPAPGRYDITAWALQGHPQGELKVRLTEGESGQYLLMLEVWVARRP